MMTDDGPALRLARDWRWFVPASAAWGFAEATVFFVIPDVIVGWVALHDWRRGAVAALAATCGALVGGTLVFLLPHAFLPLYPALPGINDRMVEVVRGQVAASGAASMLAGPLSGIPYKLYAAHLGAAGAGYAAFALLTPLARLERILPVALVLSGVGWLARRLRDARPRLTLALYAAGWTLQYAVYYWAVAHEYRGL